MTKHSIGEELEKIFSFMKGRDAKQQKSDKKETPSEDAFNAQEPTMPQNQLEKMVKAVGFQKIFSEPTPTSKVEKRRKPYTKKQIDDYQQAMEKKYKREEAQAKRQYDIDCFTVGLLQRLGNRSYEDIYRATTGLLHNDPVIKKMALIFIGENQGRAFEGQYFDAVSLVTQSLGQVLDYADYKIALQHDEMTSTPHIVDFMFEQQAAKNSNNSTEAPASKQLCIKPQVKN